MVTVTLFIPTYNRSKRLKSNLLELVSLIQRENLNSIIDILVGDNCSTDTTSLVLQEIELAAKKLGIEFNYFVNTSNLGFNENIKLGYLKFTGDYLIFISDDDNLYPGALTEYLQVITKTNPSVALINFNQKPFTFDSPLYTKDKLFITVESDFFEPLIRSPKLTGILLKKPMNYSLREEIASVVIPSYYIAHIALAIHQYSKLGRGLQAAKFFGYPDHDYIEHVTFLPYVNNFARIEINRALSMCTNIGGKGFHERIIELIPSRIVIDDSINWLFKYYTLERNLTREQFSALWSNCLRYFFGQTLSKSGLTLKDSNRKFKRIKIFAICLLLIRNHILRAIGLKYSKLGEKEF